MFFCLNKPCKTFGYFVKNSYICIVRNSSYINLKIYTKHEITN